MGSLDSCWLEAFGFEYLCTIYWYSHINVPAI